MPRFPRNAMLPVALALVVLLVVLPALGAPAWLTALLALAAIVVLFVRPAVGRRAATEEPTDPLRVVADGRDEVVRIRELADRISKEQIRDRAIGVCATADRVLTSIEQRADAGMALAFLEHYIEPYEALLTQYLHLARRDLATTAAATTKVETRDLPVFESKLNNLDLRLQRGETVDLAAASAGLDFDLATADPPPPRRRR